MWPENWDAVQLFGAMATQWRVTMGGVLGLDYPALMAVMPLYGEPSRDLLDRVRVMEATVLAEMKRDKGAGHGT